MTSVQNKDIIAFMNIKRYLHTPILRDLKQKMVFIGGPRQVGKTTLSLQVAPKAHRYFNWDILEDRQFILQQHFPAESFIIFDEIHKFKQWRGYIKGLFDKYRGRKKILITGSARLDYYRHSGDSLQGRYHYLRLHPLTVKEVGIQSQKDMQDLLTLGGFPEPFLSGSHSQARRWKNQYSSRIIHEDISSLELSQNLSQMELLLLRLKHLTGSPLSINALRKDLSLSHKTTSKYLDILERMYLIYRIRPFSSSFLRSVKKEKKCYYYNWSEITEEGPRFENCIASHLLKWVHFQQDYEGKNLHLCYFRDTDKREVDFIITEDNKPVYAIECKLRLKNLSPHLKYFKKKFPFVKCRQVYLKEGEEYISKEGIKTLSWKSFLNQLM